MYVSFLFRKSERAHRFALITNNYNDLGNESLRMAKLISQAQVESVHKLARGRKMTDFLIGKYYWYDFVFV
jgi:hypothetical protein